MYVAVIALKLCKDNKRGHKYLVHPHTKLCALPIRLLGLQAKPCITGCLLLARNYKHLQKQGLVHPLSETGY